MLNRDWLAGILHNRKFSKTDKILAVLLDEENPEQETSTIRNTCIDHGAREAKKWSISGFLTSAKTQGKVVNINGKWSLTDVGHTYLRSRGIVPPSKTVLIKARDDVRTYLTQISDSQVQAFVEEAVSCLEAGLLRSAVVMSWIGAVAILYSYVVKNVLVAFNAEAQKRNPKWKPALNEEGLARMKEYEFLEVIEAIGLIGKNEKQELQTCLQRRNGCGHPNSYKIGDQVVAAHIESLILHVYSKF